MVNRDSLRTLAKAALDNDDKLHDDNRAIGKKTFSPHVVVVIPGIRDQGVRLETLTRALEENIPYIRVVPISYNFFHALFLFSGILRDKHISVIRRKIQNIDNDRSIAFVSVIAHSFGTFIFANTIASFLSLKYARIEKIILCGGILNRIVATKIFSDSTTTPKPVVLNECGLNDVWPIIAESSSSTFGATGVFGIRDVMVVDRFTNSHHSSYFEEEFINEYWLPFFKSDVVKPSKELLNEAVRFEFLTKPGFRIRDMAAYLLIALLLSFIWP